MILLVERAIYWRRPDDNRLESALCTKRIAVERMPTIGGSLWDGEWELRPVRALDHSAGRVALEPCSATLTTTKELVGNYSTHGWTITPNDPYDEAQFCYQR